MAQVLDSPDEFTVPAEAAVAPLVRVGRLSAELAAAIVVATAISLLAQWAIGHIPVYRPTLAPNDLIAFGGAILLAGGLALVFRRTWPRWATPASWAVLSGLMTLTLSLALLGTRLFIGGLSVDQEFRTQYLTRLTSSPIPADFGYQGVAPFYPWAWFWLGGRFANLIHQPGWAAYKPWAILTLAVTAAITAVMWSMVTNRRNALVLALVTSTVGLAHGVDEPYSWLITATIPPLAILAWRLLVAITTQPGRRAGSRGAIVTLGVAMGVYGMLYTLYLALFALVLVLLGAAAVVAATRANRGSAPVTGWSPGPGALAIRVVRHYLVASVIAGAVALVVWLPFFLAVLRGQHVANLAGDFLPALSANLPMPMLEISLIGAFCLPGTVWIVWYFRRHPTAVALGGVVLAVYLWYLLSLAAIIAHTSLLAFRMNNILDVTLVCAGVFGAIELVRWLSTTTFAARRHGEIRVLAAILLFAALVDLVQGAPPVATTDQAAFHDYYPTGTNALGRANRLDDDYWVPQLSATIHDMTGKQPRDIVLLGDQPLLTDTEPFWTFQAITPQYANPLARFEERRLAVESWSRAANPSQLRSEIDHSPFAAPTVFLFKHTTAGLVTRLSRDTFPGNPSVSAYYITFPASLFADGHFVRRDVGPYTVIVRR